MFLRKHFLWKTFLCLILVCAVSLNCCAKLSKEEKAELKRIKREKKHPVSHMPQTFEEYLNESRELKTMNLKIKEPKLPKDTKYENAPEKVLKMVPYNYPPGSRTINLKNLRKEGYTHSSGVATPSGDKLVYTEVYYDTVNKNVKSEMYTILNNEGKDKFSFLRTANAALKITKPILSSAIPTEAFNQQNILTPIDWSANGQKIAIKETIGNNCDGIWQTNLWVYDYNTGSATRLDKIRRDYIDWWQANGNLNLNDYLWDIYPLGWDSANPDKLVVTAYVLKKDKRLFFLGEWLIDSKGENPKMVSTKSRTRSVQTNGATLEIQEKY